jgi:hypothetical protein
VSVLFPTFHRRHFLASSSPPTKMNSLFLFTLCIVTFASAVDVQEVSGYKLKLPTEVRDSSVQPRVGWCLTAVFASWLPPGDSDGVWGCVARACSRSAAHLFCTLAAPLGP